MSVFVMSLAAGVLLIALAVPLALGRITRNKWYGFRIGKAIDDDVAWHQANRAFGKWLVVAGIAVALSACVNLALSANIAVAVLMNMIVGTLGVVFAVAAGFAAMSADDFRR